MDRSKVEYIDAPTLNAQRQDHSAQVVDLNVSRGYYDGHIPQSWYALRTELPQALEPLNKTDLIVLTSPDGALAELAANDLAGIDLPNNCRVAVLKGGTQSWIDAGFELQRGASHMASEATDIRLKAREQGIDIEQAMRDYLAWEIQLADDMAADSDHRFQVVTNGNKQT